MATPTLDYIYIYISVCTEGEIKYFALYAQNNPHVVGYASRDDEKDLQCRKTAKKKKTKTKKAASNYAN